MTANHQPGHVRVAAGIVAIAMASSVLLFGLPLTFPDILARFRGGPFGFGVAHFMWVPCVALFAAWAVLLLAGAELLERWGTRRALAAGTVLVLAGLALFGSGQALVGFLGGALLLGLGFGVSLQLAPTALTNAWFLQRRGQVLGLAAAGVGAGGVIWALTVPWLVGQYRTVWGADSWRVAYLAFGLTVALLVGGALLVIRDHPLDVGLVALGADDMGPRAHWTPPEATGLTFAAALRAPWFHAVFLSTLALGVVDAAILVLPLHLHDHLVTPTGAANPELPLTVACVMAALSLGVAAGRVLLLGIAERISTLALVAVVFALQGIGMVYLGGLRDTSFIPYGMGAGLALGLGFAGAMGLPARVYAAALGTRDLGRIWAVGGSALMLGMAIGVPVWGYVHAAQHGLVSMLYGGGAVLVAVLVTWWLAMRFGSRRYVRPEA